MSKREHITTIEPWKITVGEHAGKWLSGVLWLEDGEQKDRQIDRPRSTHHEAQRDADALSRKIEAEGKQGDYPPLVTTQAREKADAAEVAGFILTPTPPGEIDDGTLWLDSTNTVNCACDGKVFLGGDASDAVAKAIKHVKADAADKAEDLERDSLAAIRSLEAQRNAAEQQISDAIEAMHAHGIPVDGGMVASVTTLAKAWRLLSETHNATIQEAVEARANAEKERDEAAAQAAEYARLLTEETSDLGSLRDLMIKEKQAWREAETARVEGHLMRSRAKEAASRLRAEEMHRRAQRAEGLIMKLRAAADAIAMSDA